MSPKHFDQCGLWVVRNCKIQAKVCLSNKEQSGDCMICGETHKFDKIEIKHFYFVLVIMVLLCYG